MTPTELAALDLAVAKAEGIKPWGAYSAHGKVLLIDSFATKEEAAGDRPLKRQAFLAYTPTVDAVECMRLLTKYELSLRHNSVEWCAAHNTLENLISGYGSNPMQAICAAVVALAAARDGK